VKKRKTIRKKSPRSRAGPRKAAKHAVRHKSPKRRVVHKRASLKRRIVRKAAKRLVRRAPKRSAARHSARPRLAKSLHAVAGLDKKPKRDKKALFEEEWTADWNDDDQDFFEEE
jgi:hypothetical protein